MAKIAFSFSVKHFLIRAFNYIFWDYIEKVDNGKIK